ncbi:MAG TPA: DNA-3-methyladenine glycosylase [Chloroflexota bacterium]
MRKLPREFYGRPAEPVARDLVGKVLARRTAEGTLRGRIVETEAYTGQTDPGSHAFRGPTSRNRVMFGPPGYVYVYVSYGMHYCMNVVTDTAGVAGAVLIRAIEPLEGIDEMERRRGGRSLTELCNGPGKLCQALGIDLQDYGADLEGSDIWLEDDDYTVPTLGVSARVGLSAGKDMPLRFFVQGSKFVSPGKPSAHLAL